MRVPCIVCPCVRREVSHLVLAKLLPIERHNTRRVLSAMLQHQKPLVDLGCRPSVVREDTKDTAGSDVEPARGSYALSRMHSAAKMPLGKEFLTSAASHQRRVASRHGLFSVRWRPWQTRTTPGMQDAKHLMTDAVAKR